LSAEHLSIVWLAVEFFSFLEPARRVSCQFAKAGGTMRCNAGPFRGIYHRDVRDSVGKWGRPFWRTKDKGSRYLRGFWLPHEPLPNEPTPGLGDLRSDSPLSSMGRASDSSSPPRLE